MNRTALIEMENPGLIERIRLWWEDLRAREHAVRELSALDAESLREIAADSGVTVTQLVQAAAAGAHAADEMAVMMRALNIDPAAVELAGRRAYQDMELACASCRDKKACRRDLKNGEAADHYLNYCMNADTLNELRANPDMLLS